MNTDIEENTELSLDFAKLSAAAGCVPVAVQNADTGEVILVAYTNEAAMQEAFKTRKLVLWSTSRLEMWEKGATSGHRFELVEAFVNCEQNSLLYKVRPIPSPDGRVNGICHTSNEKGDARNCFYRRINMDSMELVNVDP